MSYTYSFGEISAPRTELEALREQLEELRLENEQLKGTVASLQSQLTRQRDENEVFVTVITQILLENND